VSRLKSAGNRDVILDTTFDIHSSALVTFVGVRQKGIAYPALYS
jgi:hypothetical protein